jgi:hypothetical protein
MDHIMRSFYELHFENSFVTLTGTAFQDWFVDIMGKRFQEDFEAIRPHGRLGDLKCDGYLNSTKTVFAVYAPQDLAGPHASRKIKSDFEGAMRHWDGRMNDWRLVHNSRDLPPHILQLLQDISSANLHISVGNWGYEDLRQKVFELSLSDLVALFGPAPSAAEVHFFSSADLQLVVEGLSGLPYRTDDEVVPPPANKLDYNGLSRFTRTLLTAGMISHDQVQFYFNNHEDPGLGDRIAAMFKYRYGELKGAGMSPNAIFRTLFEFATANQKLEPPQEGAATALLSYLFQHCEIFDRPIPEDAGDTAN